MSVQVFLRESGFKVLAMARLSQCEYSIVLYTLNCAVSGLDQFITTEGELAVLIGYDERTVRDSLDNLAGRFLLRVHYGDLTQTPKAQSMRIGMQWDISRWRLDFDHDVTSQDAIVFPFRRQGKANLQVLDGQRHEHQMPKGTDAPTWQRVIEAFTGGRNIDAEELPTHEQAARTLVDTHPVDLVLLMIRHFGARIPTLSLLASSWQHYHEVFEEETQKVDLLGARQKHLELDQKVRDTASEHLERKEELELTEEDATVLQILAQHRHPRRQLFWAYQLRSRYPKLAKFFEDLAPIMIPVTSSGSVVKRNWSE